MTAVVSLYLDAGSTNTRAWVVRDREILARATAAVGVRDSARERSTERLRREIARLIAELSLTHPPRRVLAAGMITSSLGVLEVPHLQAPAGVAALAGGLAKVEAPDVTSHPLYFVPGVRTGDLSAEALATDVMRGEETLAIGLIAAHRIRPGDSFLNAGSHWKLVSTNARGEISMSRTSLGGEVVHAVQSGTILSSALPEGPLQEIDEAALLEGAAAARAHGLFRALFGVRLIELKKERTASSRFSFLMGACVGSDLDALIGEGMLSAGDALALTGPAAVPEAWAVLLRDAGCEIAVLSATDLEQAFVLGLSAVEEQAFGPGMA